MIYEKATIENGNIVIKQSREIDQTSLTSDCWLIQFEGLSACKNCEVRGKKDCGGGQTLKRMKAANR